MIFGLSVFHFFAQVCIVLHVFYRKKIFYPLQVLKTTQANDPLSLCTGCIEIRTPIFLLFFAFSAKFVQLFGTKFSILFVLLIAKFLRSTDFPARLFGKAHRPGAQAEEVSPRMNCPLFFVVYPIFLCAPHFLLYLFYTPVLSSLGRWKLAFWLHLRLLTFSRSLGSQWFACLSKVVRNSN